MLQYGQCESQGANKTIYFNSFLMRSENKWSESPKKKFEVEVLI